MSKVVRILEGKHLEENPKGSHRLFDKWGKPAGLYIKGVWLKEAKHQDLEKHLKGQGA